MFRNMISVLPPRPTPMLEDHFLSPVRDGLFSIFATALYIWLHHAVVTGTQSLFCTFYDSMDKKNLYCTCLLFCFIETASKRPVTEG